MAQLGFGEACVVDWKFWKFVPEPEFGPGKPIHTVYIVGKLEPEYGNLKGFFYSSPMLMISAIKYLTEC